MKMDKPRTAVARRPLAELEQHRGFVDRHIGSTDAEHLEHLRLLGIGRADMTVDKAAMLFQLGEWTASDCGSRLVHFHRWVLMPHRSLWHRRPRRGACRRRPRLQA